jgi:hypothetical protein
MNKDRTVHVLARLIDLGDISLGQARVVDDVHE